MKLSSEQIRQFEEDGYLFLPSVFSAEEMSLLNAEVPGLFAQRRDEVIREKGSDAPRSAFYVQTWNEVYGLLARHPRLVEPGIQVLASDKLYMHQFKINAKSAFDGAVWQWHQDYATWHNDDDMPRAAGDEHRAVPRRGERVQRAADVHSQEPPQGRSSRRGTT